MTKLDKLEFRMLARNIVHVVSYFDEEGECPWDYVERCHGRFQAFTTVLTWSIEDNCEMAEPISLGVFDDVKAATAAISRYDRWADALGRLKRQGTEP